MIRFFAVLAAAAVCRAGLLHAEGAADAASGDYCTLICRGDISIQEVNKKLKLKRSLMYRYGSEAQGVGGAHGQLSLKLDAIHQRTAEILNMHPAPFDLTIVVYFQKEDFLNHYKSVYKRDFRNMQGKKDVLAYYRQKDETIYVYWYHLSASVLAHEMAHSIIVHYFKVLPPMNIQEILSTYVDEHFYDL